MSDFSAYYQLTVESLDGLTGLAAVNWGANPPTQYRAATVGPVGRIAVNLFTRGDGEPGKAPPQSVAREGGLIVARAVPTVIGGITAQIGVWPAGGVYPTQVQRLADDMSAKLWTFPGDEVWLFDEGSFRGRIDFFVRGLNFRDMDQLLSLPARPVNPAPAAVVSVIPTDSAIPPPISTRTIYVLNPPIIDTVYNLPAASSVVGYDLIFVNPSNRRVRLTAATDFQGQPNTPSYSVGARMTAHLTSYGVNYTELGFQGNGAAAFAVAANIPPWRGVFVAQFTGVALFQLPTAAALSTESIMIASNFAGAPVTLTAGGGDLIDNAPSIIIPPNQTRIIRPSTLTRWVSY